MKINFQNRIVRIIFAIAVALESASLLFDFSFAQVASVASVPRKLDLSAYILNTDNKEVDNGNYDVRFSIYTSDRLDANQPEGQAIWQETQNVYIQNGVLRSYLGTVTPLPAINFSSGEYYIGIKIGNDSEMTPRKRVGAVALALDAMSVNGSTVGTSAGNILQLGANGKINIQNLPTGKSGNTLVMSNDSRLNQTANITVSGRTYIKASGTKLTLNQISLTGDVSGILPVANGGTGFNSYTNGDLLYGSGSTLSKLSIGSDGQILGVTNGLPTWISSAGASPHNFLSDTHTDTTPGTVARGDLITGQITGINTTWKKLALGSAGYVLRSDGSDVAWSPTTEITTLGTISVGTWHGSTIDTTHGGTGQEDYTAGDMLYYTGGTSFTKLHIGGEGTILESVGGIPAWTSAISGTWSGDIIDLAHGGTGIGTTNPANGALLIGNGAGYAVSTLTPSTGISINNAPGTITITNTGVTSLSGAPSGNQVNVSASNGAVVLSLPQDIATTSNVTFGSLTLSSPLSVANGGTGQNHFNSGDIPFFSSDGSFSSIGIGSTGQVLTISALDGKPQWSDSAVASPHNLLSTQHNDTIAGTALRGDLIVGATAPDSSIKWQRFALGQSGYYLKSNGTDLVWSALDTTWSGNVIDVAHGGTGTSTQFTPGSLVFAGTNGIYNEDNAYLYYDSSSHMLGIGKTHPDYRLDVNGNINIASGSNYLIGGTQIALNNLGDVNISTPGLNEVLAFNGADWVNTAINTNNGGTGNGINLFLDDTASDITSTSSLYTAPGSGGEDTDTVTVNSGNSPQTFDRYITSSSGLGGTQIDPGIWEFDTYAWVNDPSGDSEIQIDVYKRASNGTETLLFSTSTGDINNTSVSLITIREAHQAFAINSTDRLVVKYSGKTSNGSDVTIDMDHNGTEHYSYLIVPLITRHNDLAGLQGGASGQYYHLTQSEYTGTGSGVFARSTSPTFTTQITSPVVVGSSLADNTLVLQGTSAVGNTATSPNIKFNVGNGGGTTAMTILNNGNVGIGSSNPSELFAIGSSNAFTVDKSGNVTAASFSGNIINGSGTINMGAYELTLTGNSSLNQNLTTTGTPSFNGLTINGMASGVVINNSGSLSSEAHLSIARGGTGIGTTPVEGQLLIGTADGTYQVGNIQESTGIHVSNSNGSIAISNTGVTSLSGALSGNQVNVSASTGAITLSLPQDIATASDVTFHSLTLSTALGVTNGGTGSSTQFNQGSVVFAGASGVYNQDNANFFYDANTHNLGLGTTGPDRRLDILDASNPQMRLTYADGSVYTDLQTTSNGYLSLFPTGARVGIGTTSPNSLLDVYSGTVDSALTITSATDTYNPLLKFRADSTPTVKFSIGVDQSDSDKFKIYAGDGITGTSQFTIDQNGVTTIANLEMGEMSFAPDAGAISWVDMPVVNAVAGTVESYTAQLDGNPLLTLYGTSDGAGGVSNLGVGIGTVTPAGLFDVNGKLTVLSGGNVGIGNTNPTYNLQVAGSLGIGSTAYFGSSVGIGTTNPAYALEINTTGSLAFFHNGNTGGNILFSQSSTGAGVGGYYGASAQNFSIFGGPYMGSSMRILASGNFNFDGGNVGIGTTNPGAKLEINGSAGSSTGLAINNLGTANYGIDMSNSGLSGNTDYWLYNDSGNKWRSDGVMTIAGQYTINSTDIESGGDMDVRAGTASNLVLRIGAARKFYINGSTGNIGIGGTADSSPALMVLNGGNVGIGTTNPSYLMTLNGSASTYLGYIYNSNTAPTSAGLYIRSDGTGNLLTLDYNGTDVMTVTGAQTTFNNPVAFNSVGDVSVANDIQMTNTTAGYIRFQGPGYIQTESAWQNLDLNLTAANAGNIIFNSEIQSTGSRFNVNGSTGYVGIGTTAPGKTLDVNGTFRVSTSAEITTGSQATVSMIPGSITVIGSGAPSPAIITLKSDTTSKLAFNTPGGVTDNWAIQSNAATGAKFMQFTEADVPYLYLKDGGNVGIGTTNPLGLFSVGSSSQFQVNSSGYVSIPLGAVGTPSMYFGSDANSGLWSASADTLNFSVGGAEALRIASNGYVGIGNTNPGYLLTVGNNLFTVDANQSAVSMGTGPTAMTVDANGRVGIGTTAPGYALQVVGNMGVGSTAYFASSVGVGTSSPVYNVDVAGDINVTGQYRINGTPLSAGIWAANGNNVYNTNTANVGIGTTNPLALFNIYGSNNTIRQSYDTTHYTEMFTNASGYFSLSPTGGRVGIGTTNPSAMLDIFGASNGLRLSYDSSNYVTLASDASGNFTMTSSNASDSAITLGNNNAVSLSMIFDSNATDYYIGRDNANSNFEIGRGQTVGTTIGFSMDSNSNIGLGGTAAATSPIMYLASSSNAVGIGITAPRAALDINSYITYSIGNTFSGSNAANAAWNTGYGAQPINTSLLTSNSIVSNGGVFSASDRRLKENINTLESNIVDQFLSEVNPVRFAWKADGSIDSGFIAQDLMANGFGYLVSAIPDSTMPEDNTNGFNSPAGVRYVVKYDSIIPLLTSALKEQRTQITDINNQAVSSASALSSLENQLNDQTLSANDKINLVGASISEIGAETQNIASLQKADEATIVNHETRIKSLEDQMADIEQQNKSVIDFLSVTDGNFNLMNGKLEAAGVVAGAFTVKVTDASAPTVGTEAIHIYTDQNMDGIDDNYPGNDGKSVEVKTTAVTSTCKIFVTPQGDAGGSVWVEKKLDPVTNTYSGFVIKTSSAVKEDVKVDWFIVEEK